MTIMVDLMDVTSLLSREKRLTLLQMCSRSLPSPLHSSVCWILSERQLKTADWKHSLLVKKFGLTYTVIIIIIIIIYLTANELSPGCSGYNACT
jgi:hypothetical protein